MANYVKVTVKAEHGNSYGDEYQKLVGATYEIPADAVASLVRDGLIDDPAPVKADAKQLGKA
jgi:hypothetical protein